VGRSLLYVNPVNILNILTEILAEGQVLRFRLVAGEGTERNLLKLLCLRQGSPSAKL
jgi:hypothetical protein